MVFFELETVRDLFSDLKGSRGQGFKVSSEIKNEIEEIERMLKALIKSLESKPLNP